MPGGQLNLGLDSLLGQDGDFSEGRRIALLALELLENILTVGQHLDKHAGSRIGVAFLDLNILQSDCRLASAKPFENPKGGADSLAPLAAVELAFGSGADQQDPVGLEVRQGMQEQGLPRFAFQVAALEYRADSTAAGLVDGLGCCTEQAVFADGQNQGGSFGCSGFGGLYNKFHGVESPRQRVGFAG